MKRLENLEKKHFQAILSNLRDGKFAIPTFQREFDWGAKDILELVRSIFEDYYIGTLLFWKVSSENISSLKHEPIYGFEGKYSPDNFVLDGQQRLSAIYYSFCSPEKPFPHRKTKCYYFINLKKLLEEDFEEAFFYQWGSKAQEKFLKDKDEQFEEHIFPLSVLGNKDIYLWVKWLDEYRDYWVKKGNSQYKETREKLYDVFKEILQDYEISFVELDKKLEMSKICDIFTRINSQGKPLSIFDILNAAFLPKGIELKEEWRKINLNIIKDLDPEKMKVALLQIISIQKQGYCSPKYLYYLVPGSKKKIKFGSRLVQDVLISSPEEFMELWKEAINNMDYAIKKIMNSRDFGAIKTKFIPYPSIIPALTSIIVESKKDNYKDLQNNQAKISKWYWSSIFTKNYSSSVESQSAKDFTDIKKWFNDDERELEIVTQARRELDFLDLKKENNQSSAIYKAIFNLIILNGAKDPVTYDLPEYSSLDDHHIVPKSWGASNNVGDKINSILNRIPISEDTNRKIIRNKLPREYINEMFKNNKNKEEVYKMFESHFLSKEIIDILLRKDFGKEDFNEFLKEREKLIKEKVKILLGIGKNKKEGTLITSDSPFKNRIALIETIKSCSEYIYIIDKYFSQKGLEVFSEALEDKKLKEIKILMSIEKVDEKFRDIFKHFKEEMKKRGTSVDLNIISELDKNKIHDRFIISKYTAYNIPSPDIVARGQLSEISKSKNRDLLLKEFNKFWENGDEIISKWNEIKKEKESEELFYCNGRDASASGKLIENGFIVYKNSIANLREAPSTGKWVSNIRKELIKNNILVEKDNVLNFNKDYVFESSSAAAAVVLARTANGWNEWKNNEGRTLDQLKRPKE